MSQSTEQTDLFTLVGPFRQSSDRLRAVRDKAFPRHCFVKYGSSYCLASIGDGCPPDMLPLIFENGNTWWKPVEACERITDLKTLPRSARQMKLRFYGRKTLPTWTPRHKLP